MSLMIDAMMTLKQHVSTSVECRVSLNDVQATESENKHQRPFLLLRNLKSSNERDWHCEDDNIL